jgi:hypothetical protein
VVVAIGAEEPVVRHVDDDRHLVAVRPAPPEVLAHLARHRERTIRVRQAQPFGELDRADEETMVPFLKDRTEQLRHGLVHVEHHLRSGEARHQSGEHEVVRHRVDLHGAKPVPRVQPEQLERGQDEEGVVLEQIPADLAPPMADRDTANIDALDDLTGRVILTAQADDVDVVSVLEQCFGFALDVQLGGIEAMPHDADVSLTGNLALFHRVVCPTAE